MKTTRTLWPYGIIATFVVFFAGMITLVAIAATHKEDLVSDNYYEHELKFQNEIDSAARAKNAGAALRYDAQGRGMVVALPVTQLGQRLAGTVEFYRPDAPNRDRVITLAPGVDGTQAVNLSQFAAGPWLVRVSWEAGGVAYYLEQKIVIPAN
jgi:hypothetical protein